VEATSLFLDLPVDLFFLREGIVPNVNFGRTVGAEVD
jgi:hypothetical protein